ncbi:hypothetical protein LTR62_000422 [Meristemomyces frigidus]|uniref:DNA polymerase lambda n=1 Tax=Meristemomyces frigidus TaxID=1508187 RepID=A0AAN7YIG5_9PEZI|nr:hypothetical protein LTR62_000422 [Meristemomyces frigidus]
MATGSKDDTGDRLRAKQAFYASLDATLAEIDDEEDVGRKASAELLGRRSGGSAVTVAVPHDAVLGRSASETGLASNAAHQVTKPITKLDSARRQSNAIVSAARAAPTLMKGTTFAAAPSDPMPSAAPPGAIPKVGRAIKRKRDGLVKLVPEAQQIFKGMHFYFFPNDDNNPARAMRIMKVLEYGATWHKEWNHHITHVIVDRQLDYSQLLRSLNVSSLPDYIVTVAEGYPAECISLRYTLEPNQKRFHVKGYTISVPSSAAQHKENFEPEKTSLELKPAGRSVMPRQPESPRTTDEASEQSQMLPLEPSQAPTTANTERGEAGSSMAGSTNELDEALRQAKELRYVPLEDDGEDGRRPSTSEGPTTDDEGGSETSVKKRKPKQLAYQDKFQCMKGGSGDNDGNPNAATISILQQMADYYGQMGDEWRVRAYRKAIGTLRNHHTKVWTKEQALALPQIGERLAVKIEEIAHTNRLRRLDNAKAKPADQILQNFMGVYGAGFGTASEWVAQGYRTLDDLLDKASLTDNQRIGIEHYDDFNSRIPRAEVEQHGAVIRKALTNIDPKFEVIIGGSYRRGKATSGDIDCILTHPNIDSTRLRTIILQRLIPTLTKTNFLVAALAATSRDEGSKWHGASRLRHSSTWRRLDLLLVPSDEIGAALIYFTGDDVFNRSLRLLASTKGMRLNQRGLYRDVVREQRGRGKISEGVRVEGRDERRIFEVLGVPWREPGDRICG